MTGDYHVSDRAHSDLAEIWEYIAERNPTAADKLLGKIERIFDLLAAQPRCGEQREELTAELRSFPVGRYVVYYIPVDDENYTVEIVRVIHGSRDASRLF